MNYSTHAETLDKYVIYSLLTKIVDIDRHTL